MKYIYEIYLNDGEDGSLIGDSGEEIFDSESEARADAEEYIQDLLIDYGCHRSDLELCIYESCTPTSDLLNVYKPMETISKDIIPFT